LRGGGRDRSGEETIELENKQKKLWVVRLKIRTDVCIFIDGRAIDFGRKKMRKICVRGMR